ncbi:MAG: type I-E CRISPR-associated protein Cse2/CasB [Thermoguttaceae bacterium]
MSDKLSSREEFIEFLQKNERNTGIMADLRKGFNSLTAHYSWKHIGRFCFLDDEKHRTIFQTVGAAFATHPLFRKSSESNPNMGTVMRMIAARGAENISDALASFESRFRRILTCDTSEEVCSLLRGVISAAKLKNIRIPYLSLIDDLFFWDPNVKMRWAHEFWGVREPADKNEFLGINDAVSETDDLSEHDEIYEHE